MCGEHINDVDQHPPGSPSLKGFGSASPDQLHAGTATDQQLTPQWSPAIGFRLVDEVAALPG
jgi:hypothetical protein